MKIDAVLNHIAITISKEENLSFYKKLGFVEDFRNVRQDKGDIIVFMNGLGTTLEIFIDPNHPARPDNDPMGLRHICFEVKDLPKLHEALTKEGFDPKPINSRYNNTFIKDPDCQDIEFKGI